MSYIMTIGFIIYLVGTYLQLNHQYDQVLIVGTKVIIDLPTSQ